MPAARHRTTLARRLALVLAAFLLVACASAVPSTGSPTSSSGAAPASAFFDASYVHEIALSFDEAAYEAMIDTYVASGDKAWIEATVTIDGRVYEGAGVRLKGNSSLGSLQRVAGTPEAKPQRTPESLPWLVSLDRFADGQNHEGVVEFVVRSNPSETALNEAVALELLERAGLSSQDAIAVRFSVNGGDDILRLVVEHPDDAWMARRLSASGALYKAESTGDYSYRGDDPRAYDEVFDQEAGEENADLAPLIEFLKFVNNADDATFAAGIEQRLDVEAFATYLAMQELVGNFDDIDGPGNNSYLYLDTADGRFTVVPWDYNLAFGSSGVVDRGPAGNDGGNPDAVPGASLVPPAPDGSLQPGNEGPIERPLDEEPDHEPAVGDVSGGSNVLAKRFLAIDKYRDLVEEQEARLRAELFDSGVAADVLADWTAVLQAHATDLVDATTIATESEHVASQL